MPIINTNRKNIKNHLTDNDSVNTTPRYNHVLVRTQNANNIVYICIMFKKLSILKGLHPGFFLEHELKKKKLSKRSFALSLAEHPQTIGAITKGNRDMNTNLSLRIENALGLEEGFLMTLQAFYDIKKEKQKQKLTPNLSVFSPTLFWDTKIENIDWNLHKKSIVSRIFEYGNENEKQEILSFYGKDTVEKLLSTPSNSRPKSLNGINII